MDFSGPKNDKGKGPDKKSGEDIGAAYTFEDYKLKVNRYIENNRDHIAIHKLRNNISLTAMDFKSLEQIPTGELSSPEDYQREFQDTPFGLFWQTTKLR